MTKMLVCGGRDYDDVPWMWMHLDRIWSERAVDLVIDGAQQHLDKTRGIVGADYWAHQWAKARGIMFQRFPARWIEEGLAAGPIRNQKMIDEGRPDFIVAFQGGKGTSNMMMIAKVAGIEVIEIKERDVDA